MTGSEGGTLAPVEGRGRIGRIAHRTFEEDKANGAYIAALVNWHRSTLAATPSVTVDAEPMCPVHSFVRLRDCEFHRPTTESDASGQDAE